VRGAQKHNIEENVMGLKGPGEQKGIGEQSGNPFGKKKSAAKPKSKSAAKKKKK